MKRKCFIALLSSMLTVSMINQGAVTAWAEKKSDTKQKKEEEEILPPKGNLDLSDALVQELAVKVDGKEMKVTEYIDFYLADPSIDDQRISVYVPEGADENSPIILNVNNSGWMANSWSSRTKVANDDSAEVAEYSSNDDADKVGAVLSRNFVFVSYGGRSRNGEPINGEYDGHSPGIVADTKAVIRFLRSNQENLPAGDTDHIVITGTSGGGALSTVIAASGNSADYYEELARIGAAGIEEQEDGTFASEISDDVFAVIAYCPITDLGHADAAYEWTYQDTRKILEDINLQTDPEKTSEKDAKVWYTKKDATVMEDVSAVLAENYADYVDQLDLLLEDGTPLTSENLKDALKGLMEAEIEEAIQEVGIDQMKEDIGEIEDTAVPMKWLTFEEDGSYTYNLDNHLLYVAANKQLKPVCAFSNKGLGWGNMNEDTLFGTREYEYSAFEFYSWDNDTVEGNGCGADDTGLNWEEYVETEEGKALLKQIRMTNAIEYLNDKSDDETSGTKAANWYVRYGMNDRDSSFALETILCYSILNNGAINNANFEFAWLKPHSGDYDVTEAYAWLDEILA